MSNKCFEVQLSDALSTVIIPSYSSESEYDSESNELFEDMVFHPVLNKDIQILNEDQENSVNEKKDSGILVESYNHRFDEEYDKITSMESSKFIYEENFKFLDGINYLDIPTESELDSIIAQLPVSCQGTEYVIDESDYLDESGSSSSSLLTKLEHTMVELKEENKKKLSNLESKNHSGNLLSNSKFAEEFQKNKLNQAVMSRYGKECSTNDVDYEEDIEVMRQKLKQQSASIVNTAKQSGSPTPFECKGELQAVKVDKENKPGFVKKKIKSPEIEFSFSGQVQNSIEKQDNVCTSTSMVKTVDSMLDEVNRIMRQAAPDHDKNVLILKAAEDLPFNECSGENGTVDHQSEFSHLVYGSVSCSYVDNDMKTEVVDWSDILEKDRDNKRKFASPEKNVDKDVFESLFTDSFFSADGGTKNKISKENKNKPKTPLLNKASNLKTQSTEFGIDKRLLRTNNQTFFKDIDKEISYSAEYSSNTYKNTSDSSTDIQGDKKEISEMNSNSCKDGDFDPASSNTDANRNKIILNKPENDNTIYDSFIMISENKQDIVQDNLHNDVLINGELLNANNIHITDTNKKKKKKKKRKTNKSLSGNVSQSDFSYDTNSALTNGSHVKNPQVTEEKNTLDSKKLLYDQSVSYEEGYAFMPDTNKQILTLKIILDSPGVVKISDSVCPVVDSLASDIYIGLVTLFLLLLQGSKWEIPSQLTEIPFDVVSLLQANLDGELLLIVGITENQNTNQHKVKKSKLGSSFFHAVSQFLNTTYLEQILKRIWNVVEIGKLKPITCDTTIRQQLEHRKMEKYEIPGHGKLSSFINISPDPFTLHRILAMKSSIAIHRVDKSAKSSLMRFDSAIPEQEFTCITIQNISSMSPKQLSSFMKRMRDESVEIVGLRIGYIVNVSAKNTQSILAVCINEVSAATVQEGKLLLCNCKELNKLTINFHTDKSLLDNNEEPIINYAVNSKIAYRQVVQWFGPHFKDYNEAHTMINEHKILSSITCGAQIQKKKWSIEASNLSLLASYSYYSCLLLSSCVPSSFLAFIISFAAKRGLQLKAMCKLCISLEDQYAWKIITEQNSKTLSSNGEKKQTLLIFHGSSCSFRLLGLVKKLRRILTEPITGESLQLLCNDKLIKYKESHNRNESFYLQAHSTKHLVLALVFNDHINDLLKTSELIPDQFPFDFGDVIAKVRMNTYTPELNFIAVVIYGTTLVRSMSTFFRIVFGDLFFNCINAWRQISQSSAASFLYIPPLELLGFKYISQMSVTQVTDFVLHEPFSTKWGNDTRKMIGKEMNLVILRAVDKCEIMRLKEKMEDFLVFLRADREVSDVILHNDIEYVMQLMGKYFYHHELHGDTLPDQSCKHYIPVDDTFSSLLKVFNSKTDSSFVSLEHVPPIDSYKFHNASDISNVVYEVQLSKAPLMAQLLLKNEQSYVGLSMIYNSQIILAISKALVKMVRMGFQICALKFPVFDHGDFWMRLVFKRADAFFLLNKLLLDLRDSYQSLVWSVTETQRDLICFIEDNFKRSPGSGGIFYPNYFSYIHKLNFEEETIPHGRQSRDIDWDPDCSRIQYEYFKKHELSYTQSFLFSPSIKTDQLTVVIFTRPILSGIFCGKQLSSKCVFPELWHLLESLSYRSVGMKMTSLNEEFANMIIEKFDLDENKKKLMKALLCNSDDPFLAVAMLGSCILSNFFIMMQRNLDDKALQSLRDFSLVSQSSLQAEFLLLLLFDQVIPNCKFQIRTCVV